MENDLRLEKSRYDVIILGTSLLPTIVSSALSRAGYSVLHLDHADCYGGSFSTYNLNEFEEWSKVRTGSTPVSKCATYADESWRSKLHDPGNHVSLTPSIISDCYFRASFDKFDSNLNSRAFNIDVSPHMFFNRGSMVELLVRSTVSKYMEFRALEAVYLYDILSNIFDKVPCTKSEVFGSSAITILEKRSLMKLIHLLIGVVPGDHHAADPANLNQESIVKFFGEPFSEFLSYQKVSSKLSSIFSYALALLENASNSCDSKTETAVSRIRLFLSSIGRYNTNSAFLYTQYGMSDLPQAFARMAAVFGATFILRSNIIGYLLSNENQALTVTNFEKLDAEVQLKSDVNISRDGLQCGGVLLENGQVVTSNFVVCDAEFAGSWTSMSINELDRCCCIANGPLSANFMVSPGLFIVPPTEKYCNSSPIKIIQFDSSSKMCSENTYMFCISTLHSDNSHLALLNVLKSFFTTDDDNSKPKLLWRSFWSQCSRVANDSCPKNVHICDDPPFDLEFGNIVEQAESIFRKVAGQDELFLPAIAQDEDCFKDPALGALSNLSDDEEIVESIPLEPIVSDKADSLVKLQELDVSVPSLHSLTVVSPSMGQNMKSSNDCTPTSRHSTGVSTVVSAHESIVSYETEDQFDTRSHVAALSVKAEMASSVVSSIQTSPTSTISFVSAVATAIFPRNNPPTLRIPAPSIASRTSRNSPTSMSSAHIADRELDQQIEDATHLETQSTISDASLGLSLHLNPNHTSNQNII